MKRKTALVLLCALCLLCCLPSPSKANASGDVCFTAVNITVLPLTADSMPVWYNGSLYVPYTVFSSASTGVSLGVNSILSRDSQTVSVLNLSDMLIFDLKENVCYDQRTREPHSPQAIMRNGRPYLPAALVCQFFSLKPPSYFYTPYGYVVRIADQNQKLSDAAFADAGSEVLRNRLREYNQAQAPEEPPAQPETPEPVTTPTPPPSPQPQQPAQPEPQTPDEEEEEEIVETPVCLAFRCETENAAETIAQDLEDQGVYGLFFFPPQVLDSQGDLIRRLLGSGHSLGVWTQADNATQALEELDAGNRALESQTHSRSYCALTALSSTQPLEEAGWLCWNRTETLDPESTTPLTRLLRRHSGEAPLFLLLKGDETCAEAMPDFFDRLEGLHCVPVIPMETLF